LLLLLISGLLLGLNTCGCYLLKLPRVEDSSLVLQRDTSFGREVWVGLPKFPLDAVAFLVTSPRMLQWFSTTLSFSSAEFDVFNQYVP
jgi:hypothetical protein